MTVTNNVLQSLTLGTYLDLSKVGFTRNIFCPGDPTVAEGMDDHFRAYSFGVEDDGQYSSLDIVDGSRTRIREQTREAGYNTFLGVVVVQCLFTVRPANGFPKS